VPQRGADWLLDLPLPEVSSEGKIVYLSPISSPASYGFHLNFKPSEIVRLPRHTFLLPTFTDVHIHAPQYLYAGTGLDLPLMSWLERYAFRAETRIDGDTALAERVYTRLGQRLLENGTSAACVAAYASPCTREEG
jgi:guanine deaminase